MWRLLKHCTRQIYFFYIFIQRYTLSNEDMILALAGQFKQLSHEPEKFRWLNGIRTHDLCDAGAVLSPTELRSHRVESRSICWAHVFSWKECGMKEMLYMNCGVLKSNEDMILALAGQFKQLYLHLISNTALHITFLSLYLLIFLWTDTKLIVNLELREKLTRWKKLRGSWQEEQKYQRWEHCGCGACSRAALINFVVSDPALIQGSCLIEGGAYLSKYGNFDINMLVVKMIIMNVQYRWKEYGELGVMPKVHMIIGVIITHITTGSQLAYQLNWWSTAPALQRSGFEYLSSNIHIHFLFAVLIHKIHVSHHVYNYMYTII